MCLFTGRWAHRSMELGRSDCTRGIEQVVAVSSIILISSQTICKLGIMHMRLAGFIWLVRSLHEHSQNNGKSY